jgi:hypothetical protein
MKSRGVYETPGGTLLLTARRAMESITLDRGEAHMKVGGGGGCWGGLVLGGGGPRSGAQPDVSLGWECVGLEDYLTKTAANCTATIMLYVSLPHTVLL